MPRVSAAFFAMGVVYLLLGMSWGMHMGASEDFAMAPAHAHLNLLGWVTMAIYGHFLRAHPGQLFAPAGVDQFCPGCGRGGGDDPVPGAVPGQP